ncbi:MAG: hypothetical protein QM687_00965 [Ferruginibacter sp.]
MKKILAFFILISLFILTGPDMMAQCAMCTKTASQLGEKPAAGMNTGILYLMATPFVIMGYIGYRWWKSQQKEDAA